MFVVFRNKGRQYRASAGDVVVMDKLPADVGARVTFGEVLLAETDDTITIGTPTIPQARVEGEVVAHVRDDRVEVFKFHRRKNYRRLRGHKEPYTLVKILNIGG